MGRASRLKKTQAHKRCCECRRGDSRHDKLLQWSDHNDSGWVCGQCAQVWGYYEYCLYEGKRT
jgi:hypothetical protein